LLSKPYFHSSQKRKRKRKNHISILCSKGLKDKKKKKRREIENVPKISFAFWFFWMLTKFCMHRFSFYVTEQK